MSDKRKKELKNIKKPSKNKDRIIYINNWRDVLSKADIAEENFVFEIVELVESTHLYWSTLKSMEDLLKDCYQYNIITYSDLIEQMKENDTNGNSEENLAKNILNGISETSLIHKILNVALPEIQHKLNRTNYVSTEFLAILIKLQIMIIREKYLQRRRDREKVKQEIEKEVENMRNLQQSKGEKEEGETEEEEVGDTAAKSNKKKDKKDKGDKKEKSDKKGGGDKKDKRDKKEKDDKKEKADKKSKTNKKVKSTEPFQEQQPSSDASIAYVKEENFLFNRECMQDEPNLPIYFILCSFYEDTLIEELQELGIQVTCLLEIGCNDEENQNQEKEIFPEDNEIRLWMMNKFWRTWKRNNFILAKLIPPDTCFIKYITKFSGANIDVSICEEIISVLSNLQEFKGMYQTYLKKLQIFDVEEKKTPLLIKDLKLYNTELNKIPNECITIPLLLHFLLEEVLLRTSSRQSDEGSENKTSESEILICKNIKQKIKNELKSRENGRKLLLEGSKIIRAVNFSYGNILDYILGYMSKPKSLKNFALSILKLSKPLQLFKNFKKLEPSHINMNYDLLNSWCANIPQCSIKELETSLYAYLFEKIIFHSLGSSNVNNNNNNEDKIRKFIFGSDEILNAYPQVFLKPKNILVSTPQNNSQSNLDVATNPENFCRNIEEFDSPTMIQIINAVYDKYEHYDYKYLTLNDTILLRFYRNYDQSEIAKECISTLLGSKICFRDFCSHILLAESEYFLKEQETDEQIFTETGKDPKLVQYLSEYLKDENFYVTGSWKEEELQEKQKQEASGKSTTSLEDGEKNKRHKAGKGKKGGKPTKEKKDKTKTEKGKEAKAKEDKDDKEKFQAPKVPKLKSKTVQSTLSLKSGEDNDIEGSTTGKEKDIFDFHGYNIDSNYFNLKSQVTRFGSRNGLNVTVSKTQYPIDKLQYNFDISLNDDHLILQCQLDEIFIPINPFGFHVNFANGIYIAFENHTTPDMNSSLAYVFSNMQTFLNEKTTSSKASVRENVSLEEEAKFEESEKRMLAHVKMILDKNIPANFRIISSHLHKYQYIKRVKSVTHASIESVIRRVFCNQKLFTNQRKIFNRQPRNTNTRREYLVSKNKHKYLFGQEENHLKWNITLPTGLTIKAVPILTANYHYIKQKYITSRHDLQNLEEEKYRCFLPNGIIMKFMKNGSIITFHVNKTISTYNYGKFEIENRASSIYKAFRKKSRTFHSDPCHRNTHHLERQIKRITQRYKNHSTDITDNIRLESRRPETKKLRKVYRISKKLYNDNNILYPLINTSKVSSDGTRYTVRNNVVCEEPQKYKEITYADYLANESVVYRQDGTTWFLGNNGKATTQFFDVTRITTWPTIVNENFVIQIDTDDRRESFVTGDENLKRSSTNVSTLQDEGSWDLGKSNQALSEDVVKITTEEKQLIQEDGKFSGELRNSTNLNKQEGTIGRSEKTSTKNESNVSVSTKDSNSLMKTKSKISKSSNKSQNWSLQKDLLEEIDQGINNEGESIEYSEYEDSFKSIYVTSYFSAEKKMESFVLVNLNYMYEHPNYATVTYKCKAKKTEIKLPDNIIVNICKDGIYRIITTHGDEISYNNGLIDFLTRPCKSCHEESSCTINITPFLKSEYYEGCFLSLHDRNDKAVEVDYFGRITKGEIEKKICEVHKAVANERLFALRRNLSGQEYFRGDPNSYFVHCLQDFEDAKNFVSTEILETQNCTKIIKTLKNAYADHLMMKYDRTTLVIQNQSICKDKIWTSQKVNKPKNSKEIVLYKMYRNLIWVKNFQTDIVDQGVFKYFLQEKTPTASFEEEEKEEEEMLTFSFEDEYISDESVTKEEAIDLVSYYKTVIESGEMPKYFDILKGQMFCLVSKCVENAMVLSDSKCAADEIL